MTRTSTPGDHLERQTNSCGDEQAEERHSSVVVCLRGSAHVDCGGAVSARACGVCVCVCVGGVGIGSMY